MNTDEMTKIIKKEFAFLNERYGFDGLAVKNHGRELFFVYKRKHESVSISFEVGSKPIVEVFMLSEKTNVPRTPWASKEGVAISRLFPRLTLRNAFDLNSASAVETYFKEVASQFEQVESEWLNG